MKKGNVLLIAGVAALAVALFTSPVMAGKGSGPGGGGSKLALDFNEQTHLEFMCEEEKLARDVYLTLGAQYPQASVFGNIDDSEEQHKSAVSDKLEKYDIPNPSTSDNVGVFTGEAYGWYFTDRFNELVSRGSASVLEAYYVGAFIEELDMNDIAQCPQVIIDTDNGIDDASQCGRVYTDRRDIQRLYDSLLAGSMNHLRAYVRNIERIIGEGNYRAQYLTQDEVDEILGR